MTGLFYDEHCAVSGVALRPGRGASPTIAEAEAFRAGWRAAIEAAERAAWQSVLRDPEGPKPGLDEARGASDMKCRIVADIRALETPAPWREPPGLEERGA